jgi:hypothetical protein
MNESFTHICDECRSKDFDEVQHRLVHEAIELNNQVKKDYKLAEWPQWHYDSNQKTLSFLKDGIPQVVASVILVGSTKEDRWQWAWSNQNYPQEARRLVEPVREFGERKDWPALTTKFLPADEYTGWQLTSVAVHVLRAKGSYRFKSEDHFIYLVYRDIHYATQ